MKIVLLLVAIASVACSAHALSLDPLEACTLMDDAMDVKGRPWRTDPLGGMCSTPYQSLPGVGSSKSNVAYYASGDDHNANRLKIVLNVNDISTEKHSTETFKHYCGKLYMKLQKKMWSKEFSKELSSAISKGENKTWEVDGVSFSISKRVWPTGQGHEFHFVAE